MHWPSLDTGNCKVEYNIQLRSSSGTILSNITAISNNINIYCTDDYPNTVSVIMWATHKGIKGIKTQAAAHHTTPKTLITFEKGTLSSFLLKMYPIL